MFTFSLVLFLTVISLPTPKSQTTFKNVNISSLEVGIRQKRQWNDPLCTLPKYPGNGRYTVGGAPDARPGQNVPAAQLVISCHPGYRPKGPDTVICVNGIWSAEIPQCVRHCRLNAHPSVTYRCSISEKGFDEGFRECNEYEPAGTSVKPQCNEPNYYYTGVKTLMRCIDGRWDHVVICTPDCGRVTPAAMALLIGGREVMRGEFPWHAGIYLKPTVQPERYHQICGSSIISTRVVISAAHCFWLRGNPRQPSEVAVAIGKLYRAWNDPHDEDAQKFDVNNIKLPVRYQDSSTNYQDDIAIVTLSAAIIYRPHVRPVCVDFDPLFDRAQLKHGAIGKVAGWGFVDTIGTPSAILKVLELPYVKVDECIKLAPPTFQAFITSDKICAGYQNGSAVCRGDSGGGLVFPALDRGLERYYLRGIVSTAPKSEDECNAYAIASFTQVLAHASFIEENTVLFDTYQPNTQPPDSNFNSPPCVLPPYPRNGVYTEASTPSAVPGQIFMAAQLEIKCNPGFILEENVSPSCSFGRWSAAVPDCVRYCTLPEDNNSYSCSKENGEEYDCGQFEPSGVTAKILSNGMTSGGMTCVNGEWKPLSLGSGVSDRFDKWDCGVGNLTNGVEQPWVAALYKNNKQQGVNYWCGATIIKPAVVITAHNCVWNKQAKQAGHPSKYIIAAGVRNPKWDDGRELVYRQVSEVAKISIPTSVLSEGVQDVVAVIHLRPGFTFNPRVQPACLDFNFTYVPMNLEGVEGKVSSWILERDGVVHNSGQLTSVDVVPKKREDCYKFGGNTEGQYQLTMENICVKHTAGPTVGYGDGGMAFVVPATVQGIQRYFLRGFTSITRPVYVYNDRLAILTDIAYFAQFITENLQLE